MHPTIKFMTDWSKTLINFLDVTVSIAEGIPIETGRKSNVHKTFNLCPVSTGIIETDMYVRPTDSHQYLLLSSYHPFYCKRVYHIARHLDAVRGFI